MNKFDTNHDSPDYLMTVNHLTAGLNMPTALKSRGEGKEELPHGLPPYHSRRAFLVDSYPACPPEWLRSTGRIKSYFVPIIEGNGLWLDFNACLKHVPSHVAIVISIQGVNAITGLPCKDAQLEQYRDECPKHKKAFGPDRLCNACGFKWPKQNYLTSTGQPNSQLWLDGFRAEDGFIRQYVFTTSAARGIAKAVIGEDRVFALGISYFLSKEPRPAQLPQNLRSYTKGHSGLIGDLLVGGDNSAASFFDDVLYDKACLNVTNTDSITWSTSNNASFGQVGQVGPSDPPETAAEGAQLYDAKLHPARNLLAKPTIKLHGMTRSCAATPNSVAVKKLEVAAGARIEQRIYDDPNDLEFWQKEPEGLLIINYCSESEADAIIAAGTVDVSGSKEGFMDRLPVGN